MPVSADENIVRAVCSDKWDGERLSPSLFKGSGTSVSRLALINLEDHWELFRENVERPPARTLEMIAEINVGVLQEVGLSHAPQTELTVEPSPLRWNPAHAEIPQKISRGLANAILPKLTLHSDKAHIR